MRTLRSFTVGLAALAVAAVASAQFDGPAPLAWRWVQPTNAAPSGAPLVVGDTIYTAIGGRVFALDRATGNLKWRYPQVDPIDGSFRSAPILVNGLIVAAADNKIVYAIDPNTGASKWSFNSPSPVLGQPVAIGNNVAYATSDNKLMAIDTSTGQGLWKQPYAVYDGIQGQIAAYGGGIVYFTGRNDMRSLDLVSQKANYQRPTKFGVLPPGATPVLFGDMFYVSSGPYLIAINAATGLPKWQRNTGMELAFTPAVGADGILVVSQDGQAMVYDTLTGQPAAGLKKGPVKLGSYPAVRPSVAGSKFIVPTSNGAVNLFDPKNGSLLWSFVIRPIGEVRESDGTSSSRPGPGKGFAPGGTSTNQGKLIVSLPASGSAVLVGQTLIVPAKDGSILAFDKDLGVDLTPPTVTQLWPNQGDVVSGQPPLELIFRATDEAAGVNESTIKVEIDGQAYDYTYTRDGFIRVAFSTVSGKNPTLQDGRHAVVVTVTDWMGNVSKTTTSLVIDNALKPLALPGNDQTGQNNGPGAGGPGGGGGPSSG